MAGNKLPKLKTKPSRSAVIASSSTQADSPVSPLSQMGYVWPLPTDRTPVSPVSPISPMECKWPTLPGKVADKPASTTKHKLSKTLPPIPAANPPYDLFLANIGKEPHDRYIIYVETNSAGKAGWTFSVRGPDHTHLSYDGRKSKSPLVTHPRGNVMEFVGTVLRPNFDKINELLRALPPPGTRKFGRLILSLPSLRHEDDYDWCQLGVHVLEQGRILNTPSA